MKLRAGRLIRGSVKALSYTALGALAVLVIGFIVYVNSREDLGIWHLADLDEEYTVDSNVDTFEDYLALEKRRCRQTQKSFANRYQARPFLAGESLFVVACRPAILGGRSDLRYSLSG